MCSPDGDFMYFTGILITFLIACYFNLCLKCCHFLICPTKFYETLVRQSERLLYQSLSLGAFPWQSAWYQIGHRMDWINQKYKSSCTVKIGVLTTFHALNLVGQQIWELFCEYSKDWEMSQRARKTLEKISWLLTEK